MDKLKNIAEKLDVILSCMMKIFMIGVMSIVIFLIILFYILMIILIFTNTPLNIEFMRLL